MAAQPARVIDLDEYRARRDSQVKKSISMQHTQSVWWMPVLMWMPIPAAALYWRVPVME